VFEIEVGVNKCVLENFYGGVGLAFMCMCKSLGCLYCKTAANEDSYEKYPPGFYHKNGPK
jgi:hypothetical protein